MGDHAIENGDCKDGEELAFIDKDKATDSSEDEYPLLTKEDLMRIDRENPRWRWLRISLVVLFWVVWFGLIAVSAIYIAFTPKCAPRPIQEFWQSGVGYWVNPFAFKDSNGDLVGDIKGLATAIDYISENVGAGFVILTSMTPYYPKEILFSSENASFKEIHPALGTIEDFESFLRASKKKGLKVVVTLDFNSVSLNSVPANSTYLTAAGPSDKFCRTGTNCTVSIGGFNYYSTFGAGSNSVDLNLKSPEVLEEIKNATRFWLSKGVDGILLANAAFYVEEGVCNGLSWSDSFPDCKLYTAGTISVIQELRKVVDEESAKSSRNKVLIADPGDTDYTKMAEKLLGTEENPGAHVVVSRYFTFKSTNSTLGFLDQSENTSLWGRFALTAASPSDKPYSSLFSAASVLLLPGTPLVYAGSELGWSPKSELPPKALYPFGEKPVIGDVASHLPMPWDSRGANFSDSDEVGHFFQQYIDDLGITETVETAMAAGRGSSIFGLTQSLIQLRKDTPSLQWGSFNLTEDLVPVSSHSKSRPINIFKRGAPGFDSIFVVMVSSGGSSSVVDFSAHCSALSPLVVYPPNSAFEPNVEMSNLKVYLKSPSEDNLYVFKCVA